MATTKRTNEELAWEAAEIIENCDLHGEELRTYLAAFLYDCGVGDQSSKAAAHKRHERAMAREG